MIQDIVTQQRGDRNVFFGKLLYNEIGFQGTKIDL